MSKESNFKEAFKDLLDEFDAEMHVEEEGLVFVQFNSGDSDYFYFSDAGREFIGIDK